VVVVVVWRRPIIRYFFLLVSVLMFGELWCVLVVVLSPDVLVFVFVLYVASVLVVGGYDGVAMVGAKGMGWL